MGKYDHWWKRNNKNVEKEKIKLDVGALLALLAFIAILIIGSSGTFPH